MRLDRFLFLKAKRKSDGRYKIEEPFLELQCYKGQVYSVTVRFVKGVAFPRAGTLYANSGV